jgi:hypothetical protein
MMLDFPGNISIVVIVTSLRVHDVRILNQLPIESSSIDILDRCCIDFGRLRTIHHTKAFCVILAKNNACFQRLYSQPVSSEAVR